MDGTFFLQIRRYFLNCNGEECKQIDASRNLLAHIANVVPKNRRVLYIDGKPTLERDHANQKRLNDILERQQDIDIELSEYKRHPSASQQIKIARMALKIFRFTDDLKKIAHETAKKQSWDVIVTRGEAKVEISEIGGFVISGDSDMLFYPKIDTIIRSFCNGFYRIYHKSEILARLQLSNAAFTTLGIIPSNDYKASFYKGEMNSIYKVMFDIQQSNPQLISIKDILEAYISRMNAQTEGSLTFEDYTRSYRVFVLQEEQLFPPSYDISSGYFHTPGHYLNITNTD